MQHSQVTDVAGKWCDWLTYVMLN